MSHWVEWFLLLVSQSVSTVAVAETQRQLRKLEEGESPLLEAVTKQLVKTVTMDTWLCVTVIYELCLKQSNK
jgi:hypothetical protein